MESEFGGMMEVAALGRPFSLGMLYDSRKDSLVPGMTFWDSDDLKEHVQERPQTYNDFEIVASESIEGKSSALHVNASLKASFLSGLVEVDGSAKYLNDSKTSKNQARVTMKYKATTKVQELSMNHLGRGKVKHPYVFDSGLATHVVIAILYGAQAFFVFDREVSEKEDLQDIQGHFKVMIKKIPFLSIESGGSLKAEDKDRTNADKFSCRFYGDFCLQKPPTTFQDSVELYQSLPKLLGPNGEKAVPVKVWLLPLTSLDSSAAKLVRQISTGLVQEAQSVLEDFTELDMRCNDAMTTTTAQQFPQIVKKLKDFKQMCSRFKLEFQQTLAKKLLSIRGGGEEEAELAEILRKRHSSPFNSNNLNEWVDGKEREIYTVKSFTKRMTNTKFIPSQSYLHKESLSAEHVVCFVFTSLGSAEPTLSALSNYLKGQTEPDDHQSPLSYDVEKEQWYASEEVADEMRKKAKLFRNFAMANKKKKVKFLTVGLTNDTYKGSSIYLYENGFTITENFEPPSKLKVVAVCNINHNSVTLKISPPKFGAENITSYSVEYCVHGKDRWQQEKQRKAEEVTVSDLRPNSEYIFRGRAVTSAGVGPAKDVIGSVKTLPCSPPGKPTAKPNSSEMSVSWEKPAEIGQGVQISSYILEYAEMDKKVKEEDLRWKQTLSKGEQVIISGLQAGTEYAVRVRCDCGEAGRSKQSITVKVCTTTFTRLADVLRRMSEQIKPGSPSVHKLPLKEEDANKAGCRWYKFGKESSRQNRTILLLGATGSGKSTLINGMVNYIVGVEWEDDFRLTLTEDLSGSGVHSQTSEVTVYKIHHQDGFKIPFSLTIVDTPEFGDTGGCGGDDLSTEQLLWSLFSAEFGVTEVDVECFVAPAGSAQLTPAQKHLLDFVFSIIGKDVEDNIRILVTSADRRRPAVLEAIKASGVRCPETDDGLPLHFKFNNSVLFIDNKSSEATNTEDEDEDGGFDRMCWIMWTKSMKRFFDALNVTDTKSLTPTPKVLRERRYLEQSVDYLQEKIELTFAKFEEIKETRYRLDQHQKKINRNRNFEFVVTGLKPYKVEISGGGNIFNCQQCHVSCLTSSAADGRGGAVVESHEFCSECPGKCCRSVHFLQKYTWEFIEVKQKLTVEKVKEKYLILGHETTIQEMVHNLYDECVLAKDEMKKLLDESVKCLNRLKEISLKPNPLSTAEYINLVIKGEQSEAKPGWKDRVWFLRFVTGETHLAEKTSV